MQSICASCKCVLLARRQFSNKRAYVKKNTHTHNNNKKTSSKKKYEKIYVWTLYWLYSQLCWIYCKVVFISFLVFIRSIYFDVQWIVCVEVLDWIIFGCHRHSFNQSTNDSAISSNYHQKLDAYCKPMANNYAIKTHIIHRTRHSKYRRWTCHDKFE